MLLKKLKQFWKDPVWATVIATPIVAAFGALGTYLFGLWPDISKLISSGAAFAGQPNQLPNWMIWLLAVVALPGGAILLMIVWTTLRPPRPLWHDYIEDDFFGLRWRWRYFSGNELSEPTSFCPNCDFQLFPHRASGYVAVDRIGYHCDGCNTDIATFDESYDELQSKIRRLIQQKLRSGAWADRVASLRRGGAS